jgi:hypothetical protein
MRDATTFEHQRIIGDREHLFGMLLDDDRTNAFVADDRAQRAQQLLDQHRCQAFERLVQQQHARIEHQRPADSQHLLLAAGKLGAEVRLAFGETRKHCVYARRASTDRGAQPPSDSRPR